MKILFLFIAFAVLMNIACERQSTDMITDDKDAIGDIVQLGGCARGELQKDTEEDSCFTYSFHENLIVDFCVTANCCPDSNRFEMEYSIDAGIIHVTVVDTAGNLYRCICPYLIHAEFSDLSEEQYKFQVEYYDEIIYDEFVKR